MDAIVWREKPTEEINLRVENKSKQRTKALQEVLWQKRNPQIKIQSIKGYDLSKCYRRKKFKLRRCWICGSTSHLKINCPVHRESQLKIRVIELEERIQEIEAAILNQRNNKKKRDRKRQKKLQKKKKKKHLKLIKAMDIAVRIRGHLLKEEQLMTGIHAVKGAQQLENAPRKDRQRIINTYKALFDRDCVLDIADSFFDPEDYPEMYQSTEPSCMLNDPD